MMYLLQIRLPANRENLGQLQFLNKATGMAVFGPVPCYGRSDHGYAADHGNPGAVSTKEFGDSALGGYVVTGKRGPDLDAIGLKRFGPQERLCLKGVSGEAAIREAWAKGTLRIHGGAAGPGYVDPTQRYLRPTNGCFRLTNSDMAALLKALGDSQIGFPFGLEVGEGQDFPLIQGGADTGEPPFRDD